MGELVQVLEDKRCYGAALDNPLRRTFVPPRRDLDLLGLAPGMVVADLGTGVGYLLPEVLRRIGPTGRVVAVDPDEENLELARRRVQNDPRVTFYAASAAGPLAVPSGTADRVLLSLVLCCLVDKTGALEEAWRLLRPGGLLLASYPRRRLVLRRGRASLRVTSDLWERLVHARPWEVLEDAPGRVVVRHRLRKPPEVPAVTPGA